MYQDAHSLIRWWRKLGSVFQAPLPSPQLRRRPGDVLPTGIARKLCLVGGGGGGEGGEQAGQAVKERAGLNEIDSVECVEGIKLAGIVTCVTLACFLMLMDTMVVSNGDYASASGNFELWTPGAVVVSGW
ncbi:hypothetical protein M406DRAFT_320246 [Cryphonectria parasitica EP155]|uniref:Uncharacterized protein n=1 Tax=Cryphonectria parasitica (strain ATCC 38755 / EP155) TaxID=660469 RepID=A0A9P5CTY8_CRYP1|nr:uncharacterized protein M406DRAFT_320246 [Cryphonectria parasitica EP155]KAF3770192.1 hypothetical protein M406DRAFT_320246 [Cryphonectria parasitica EP155]